MASRNAERHLARIGARAVAAGAALLYLFALARIAQQPEGDGSGMQWVAAVPLGFLCLAVVLTALYAARRNADERLTPAGLKDDTSAETPDRR